MSVGELRSAFLESAAFTDRATTFRNERLEAIEQGDTPVDLVAENGSFVIHLVPLSAFSGGQQVDISEAYRRHTAFRPVASPGYAAEPNLEGLIAHSGGDNKRTYTQLFRNGAVEYVKTRAYKNGERHRLILSEDFGGWVYASLSSYLSGMRDLSISPPIMVALSFLGVLGVALRTRREYDWDEPPKTIRVDRLLLPPFVIEQYGDVKELIAFARPAFDTLWNTAGVLKSTFFDADGKWVGPTPQV